jgi:hypothetical protein
MKIRYEDNYTQNLTYACKKRLTAVECRLIILFLVYYVSYKPDFKKIKSVGQIRGRTAQTPFNSSFDAFIINLLFS